MKKNITCLGIVLLLAILTGVCIRSSYNQSESAASETETVVSEATIVETTAAEPTAADPVELPGFVFPASVAEINWDNRDVFKYGLVPESQAVLNELHMASTYYISLDIPEDLISDLQGHLTVRYFNAENVPLDQLYFRLFPNFQGGLISVTNLTVDGETAATTLESLDPRVEENPLPTALRVDLASELQPGGSVVLEMDFSLDIPIEMGGNYGLYGYFEDVLVLDTFYPMIPAYDEKDGWYSGFPQPNGDHTYNDASFYLVQVQAPADLMIASSGVVLDNQISDGTQTVVFGAGPARDFYLAGSREYVELEETTGDLTVRILTREEYKLHQELALNYARDSIEIFSKRVGDYPYTEFEVVSSKFRALGIEYPGITNILVDEFVAGGDINDTPSEIYLETTTVHEVAHMYFYNAVGNDQQNEPWLDEALAQYMTYIYYLDKYGNGDGYANSWYGRWNYVDFAEIPIGMSAGEYYDEETEVNSYSAIVYGRGPIFFLELEKELGLDTVMTAIQNYYLDNLWGIAQPEDMLVALEEACECELDEIWNEWVNGE